MSTPRKGKSLDKILLQLLTLLVLSLRGIPEGQLMTYPIRVEVEESDRIAVVSVEHATKNGRFPDSQGGQSAFRIK